MKRKNNLMCKNDRKYYIIWGLFFGVYIAFIAFFSYLYPLGKDEILGHEITTFPLAWKAIKLTYHYNTLRLGPFLGTFLLVKGKPIFLLLNPFMQIASLLSVFYFIYLRLPSFKNLKDFPVFLLLTLLCTFFIAKPDNTIFWIGGAATYSWPFIFFMIFLIYLRKYYKAPAKSAPVLLWPIYFIFGFSVGWLHENTSPMAFCIMFIFGAWFLYKKRKLNSSFWIIFIGMISGLIFYFTSPGLHARLNIPEFKKFFDAPLYIKLFWHIASIDSLLAAFLYIPVFLPFLLLYRCYNLRKDFLKNENLVLSSLCYICAFVLAMVLCMAPLVPERAFYSASIMFVCSFLFLLQDFIPLCEFNLTKTFAFFLTVWILMIMPIFYTSYKYLYDAYQTRQKQIEHAYRTGQKSIYLEMIRNLRTFPENLATLHYDPMGYYTTYEKYLGLKIDSDIPIEERRN
ncbi:MAG: hypothetical protein J5594_01500 [Elusimicrobiaceae bacterium]|nr:hypothetical protein [Elusimicrobiaceae bacterium]